MARYVKTSDGYIGKVENTKVYIKDEWFSINDIKCFFIRQADTIEELCDEFVVAYEDSSRIVYSDLAWAKTKANASLEFGHKSIIYGAVWCEFGLKYVAKLNDKKELELI